MAHDWQSADIQVRDLSIHYVRTGGDKPPLVLAHGFSDNGMCWLPVAQALSASYDVILPDARGHGLSSRVHPGQAVNRAEDLAGFIQVLGLNRPIVGGHSMGAVTASILGAHHPELASALILEDPAWIEPAPDQKQRWSEDNPWRRWLESVPNLTLEQIVDCCRTDHPTWPEIELLPWAESKKQLDLNVFHLQEDQFDWKEVARQINLPTLLITGDPQKGAIVSPESAKLAQQINPLIRIAHIPAVGHNIRRENFQAYIEAIWAFLSGKGS